MLGVGFGGSYSIGAYFRAGIYAQHELSKNLNYAQVCPAIMSSTSGKHTAPVCPIYTNIENNNSHNINNDHT